MNLAGEPRDTVVFEDAEPDAVADAPDGIDADALLFRGALTRAGLMAGALLAMSDLTVEYTSERRQFGQAVGRFQAVQAHLVRCAEEAALVDLAVQVAAREADRGTRASRSRRRSCSPTTSPASRRAPRIRHTARSA